MIPAAQGRVPAQHGVGFELNSGKRQNVNKETKYMKKSLILAPIALTALLLLTGCLNLSLGGGSKSQSQTPTVGQQLIDLKNAKDSGAISDAEYQKQKEKLLSGN
jgi:hypothetical protein